MLRGRVIIAVIILVLSILVLTSLVWSQREFPAWDEGVFAEVARRHGDAASGRLRDVYNLIVVHLNDPVKEQLEVVNSYMNGLTWIADAELWKREDYWATPFETVTTFGGDCEDIAIAKYTVLLLMGISDTQLAFAHVLTKQGEPHMVLLYRSADDQESLVLDNQVERVLPASQRPDLRAIYAFNNDNTVFVIKDDGDGNRSLLATKSNKRLSKWLSVKERARANSASLQPFNDGRPLAPDWARSD